MQKNDIPIVFQRAKRKCDFRFAPFFNRLTRLKKPVPLTARDGGNADFAEAGYLPCTGRRLSKNRVFQQPAGISGPVPLPSLAVGAGCPGLVQPLPDLPPEAVEGLGILACAGISLEGRPVLSHLLNGA